MVSDYRTIQLLVPAGTGPAAHTIFDSDSDFPLILSCLFNHT